GQRVPPDSNSKDQKEKMETGETHCPTSVKGVVVVELDPNDQEVHRTIFPDDYVRLIRQTEQGTYLMSCNDCIREGSRDGKYLREFPVELDPAGKFIRKFGGKESVPEKVRPFFNAMCQLLPNGNIVLANWQGHG